MKTTQALQDAENESEHIQVGDAGSDQYQGSTDESKQVINQNGANNETVQESSNIETQVQVGSEDDVQVQNSDIVTDQSATTDGDDNLFLKQAQMIQLNLKILLEMLHQSQNSYVVQHNLLYQLAITIQSQSSSFTIVKENPHTNYYNTYSSAPSSFCWMELLHHDYTYQGGHIHVKKSRWIINRCFCFKHWFRCYHK